MKATRNRPINRSQAYFDCNATTPVFSKAAKAALAVMQEQYGNPSSSHKIGLQARRLLESSRKTVAKSVGAKPEQIVFTSGATESIQTAIFSCLQFWKNHPNLPDRPKILFLSTEHKAVPEAIHHWVKTLELNYELVELPVDSNGQIEFQKLKSELPKAILLCTMWVNNETGVIQKLDEIEKLLVQQKSQALWLIDGVQALGKLDMHLNSTRIDYAVFSGHKIYAPKGIGFLYFKREEIFHPLMVGGGQEKGHRSGSENLPGVVGLGVALDGLSDRAGRSPFQPSARLFEYRHQILTSLRESFPSVVLNTPLDCSVPTTINFSMPGFKSSELLDVFDSVGLRVSAGSACTSASAEPSHVLTAMGVPDWRSRSSIRLSFGPLTSQKEVDRACKLLKKSASALSDSGLLSRAVSRKTISNDLNGVIQLRSGPINSWLILNNTAKTCIIIDPVSSIFDRVTQVVRSHDFKVLAVLDTHDHADHETARPTLQSELVDQISSEAVSLGLLGWPMVGRSRTRVLLKSGDLADALILETRGDSMIVLARVETPGHTENSTTYLFGSAREGAALQVQMAFCGDLILSGGIGRSDLGPGDTQQLFYSLAKIKEITQENTLFCSAHDYVNSFATTFKRELNTSEILRLTLNPESQTNLTSFVKNKNHLDEELRDQGQKLQAVLCGVTSAPSLDRQSSSSISISELDAFLNQVSTPPLQLIDVRERQEFILCKNWKQLGLKEAPRNVPLSQLVNLMSELLNTQDPQPRLLFLCRSGNRSLQAAQALRQIGYLSVWSLEGGISIL